MRHNLVPQPVIEYPKWVYKDPEKLTGGVVVQDADEEAATLRAWLADAEMDATLEAPDAGASAWPADDNPGVTVDAPRRRGRPPKSLTNPTSEE